MQVLWLGLGHTLTDDGARHLLDLKSLERLGIQGSKLSPATVQQLQQLPELTDLYLTGEQLRRDDSGDWVPQP